MLVAVYGTLRKGQGNNIALRLDQEAEFVETCHIKGTMFSLGGFPGVLTGPNHTGLVVVDLYFLPEKNREKLLHRLDRLEGYRPDSADNESNMYVRKTTVTDTGRMVFYYEWNWEVPENRIISHGDWVKFKEDRYVVKVQEEPQVPATII